MCLNYTPAYHQIVTYRVPFQLLVLSTLLQPHVKMAVLKIFYSEFGIKTSQRDRYEFFAASVSNGTAS